MTKTTSTPLTTISSNRVHSSNKNGKIAVFRTYPKLVRPPRKRSGRIKVKFSTHNVDRDTCFLLPRVFISTSLRVGASLKDSNNIVTVNISRKHEEGIQSTREHLSRTCKGSGGKQDLEAKTEAPRDVSKKQKRKRKDSFAASERNTPELAYCCSACDQGFISQILLTAHERNCIQLLALKSTEDIREGNSWNQKGVFMHQLGMMVASNNNDESPTLSPGSPAGINVESSKTKPKTRYDNHAWFFRKNYTVPISGIRGRKILGGSSNGLLSNPENAARKLDLLLSEKIDPVRASSRVIKSRQFNRKGKKKPKKIISDPSLYSHSYLFSKRQKLERHVELVVDIKAAQFHLLNRCMDCTVRLTCMKPSEIEGLTQVAELPKRFTFRLKPCQVNCIDLASTVSGRAVLDKSVTKQDGSSANCN